MHGEFGVRLAYRNTVRHFHNLMNRSISILFCISLTAVAALANDINQTASAPRAVRASKAAAELHLGSGSPDEKLRVIVQFKAGAKPRHHDFVAARGGSLNHELGAIRSAAYTATRETVEALANDPDVEQVSPDLAVKAFLDVAGKTVGADLAFNYGWDGTGIGVAVIDSGVTLQTDLRNTSGDQSRIVYSESFLGGGIDDHFGHGTHVAGILGGNGKKSSGTSFTRTLRGIAPNVNIINLRALDQQGAGTDSQVIAAIQRAIALKSAYNIKVINLSLGRPVAAS